MFGLLSSMFGLLLYWGLISLPATTRRDEILPGASDVIGSISHSLYSFFIENPWACRERATCNGLAVGLACVGLVLFYIYIYIFQILVQIFFGFFFFCLKVEQIIFFFLI